MSNVVDVIDSELHAFIDGALDGERARAVAARIAADLRAEGLIREPEVEAARPVLIPSSRRRWNPFWLAPVATAILAAGAYVLNHKPTQPASAPTGQQAAVQQPQAAAKPAAAAAPGR